MHIDGETVRKLCVAKFFALLQVLEPLEWLVGVAGFEPATPSSRNMGARRKPNGFNKIRSRKEPFVLLMFRETVRKLCAHRLCSQPLGLRIGARLRSCCNLGFEVVPRLCERVCGFLLAVGSPRISAVVQIDLDARLMVHAIDNPQPEAGGGLRCKMDASYLLSRHGIACSIVERLVRPCAPPLESVSFHGIKPRTDCRRISQGIWW